MRRNVNCAANVPRYVNLILSLKSTFPPRKERPEKKERVKKERPERKVSPVLTDTAILEKETEVAVVALVQKANDKNSNEENSEEEKV